MQQLRHEATHEEDPQAALAEIEAEAGEYRHIAERRVRLGLLLSEIGAENGVEISDQEMNRLIAQAASQYQGKDRDRFIQYVQQEPAAAAQLRAPLYEDKVVDFLFSKAEITERKATREEIEADLESEEGHVHGPGCGHDHHDHAHEAKPAKGKKAAAKKESKPETEPAEAKQPVKTKAEKTPEKAKLTPEKTEKPKPAKPLKSEPANKAAAEKVEKAEKAEKSAAAKAEAKPAAKKASAKKK
jgi:trigger factor